METITDELTLLTYDEVAERLKTTRYNVQDLVRKGRLATVSVGSANSPTGPKRITEGELRRFILERTSRKGG